jgi:hypothetical protein
MDIFQDKLGAKGVFGLLHRRQIQVQDIHDGITFISPKGTIPARLIHFGSMAIPIQGTGLN